MLLPLPPPYNQRLRRSSTPVPLRLLRTFGGAYRRLITVALLGDAARGRVICDAANNGLLFYDADLRMETQTLSAREAVARVVDKWWGLGLGECRDGADAWDWTC